MANFGPPSPNPDGRGGQEIEDEAQHNGRQEQRRPAQQDARAEGSKEASKKNKKKKQIADLIEKEPAVASELQALL